MSYELVPHRMPTKQVQDKVQPDSEQNLEQESETEVRAKKTLVSRIIERFRTFLRVQGLSALSIRRHSKDEPPKVLLKRSIWLTIAHCTIHIIPVAVSIVLVVINLQGYFVGSELQGFEDSDVMKEGFLQVAAKIQV